MGFFRRLLPVGALAPDFTLRDQDGRTVTLSGLRGHPVVLVFYPGDDTPVCRKQLCELRDNDETLRLLRVQVIGLNPQSQASHRRFSRQHSFPFPLLVDKGQRVASLYGTRFVWTLRSVYLIGADGLILYAAAGKPPLDEILRHLDTAAAGQTV